MPNSLIKPLSSGYAGAPSGYAYFYSQGTNTQAVVYDGDGNPLAQPIALDENGAASVFASAKRRMRVVTAAGVEVADEDPVNTEVGTAVSLETSATSADDVEEFVEQVEASFGAADAKVLPAGSSALFVKEYLGRLGVLGELFGITADGASDDTAALQTAVSYIAAQKARPWLQLPRGTIKITSLVTVTYDATTAPYAPRIKGGGSAAETAGSGNGTVIKNHGTTTGALQFIGAFPDPVQLEDFQICCDTDSTGKAIETQNTSSHLIAKTVTVDDHDIGFEIAGTARLTDCVGISAARAAGRALLVDGAGTEVVVVGGSYTASHASARAISTSVASASGLRVVGSRISSTGTAVHITGGGTERHTVVGCLITGAPTTDFNIAGTCTFQESGNVFQSAVPTITCVATASCDFDSPATRYRVETLTAAGGDTKTPNIQNGKVLDLTSTGAGTVTIANPTNMTLMRKGEIYTMILRIGGTGITAYDFGTAWSGGVATEADFVGTATNIIPITVAANAIAVLQFVYLGSSIFLPVQAETD